MKVRLIDVQMDLGAGRRGVDMGPSALRLAGIREKVAAMGIEVEDDSEPIAVAIRERGEAYDPHLRFLPEIASGCTRPAEPWR